jgi:predicted AAA+ superfamily ATPase
VHFLDSGLLCHLLGIQGPDQIRSHPLRGSVFESWVVSELLKQRFHRGLQPNAFHYREVSGLEVYLMVQDGLAVTLLEAKSGQTMDGRFLDALLKLQGPLQETQPGSRVRSALVYGGDQPQTRQGVRVLPWRAIEELRPARDAEGTPGT